MTAQAFKTEPSPFLGGEIPFLEKFDQGDSSSHVYQLDALILSIERHLSDLLSTRCCAKQSVYTLHMKNPLSVSLPAQFGLPESLFQDAVGAQSWKKWEKIIQNVIETYEPRLKNIQVTIAAKDINKQALRLQIRGMIHLKQFNQTVDFPLVIQL